MLEDWQPRSLRACSRDDPECGARRGVPRWRLRNRSPREAREVARQALRPGCEEFAVTDPAQMPAVAKLWRACSRSAEASAELDAGERSAAPGEKPPRWSAERRASRVISAFTRVLTRYGTQGASQAPGLPRHVQAQRVLRTHPNVSRRSAPSSDNQMNLLGDSGRRAA